MIYKIAIYNENNLYRLSESSNKTKINKSFIKKHYFNKRNNLFENIFKSDNIIVYNNLVLGLIEYHKKLGNDNFVERLSNTVFHNDLVMIIDDHSNESSRFPWMFNNCIYNMFLLDDISVSPQIVFITEDQFNSNVSYSKEEYDLFFQDIVNLLNICKDCTKEYERHLRYNELIESDENKAEYRWPESIKIHIGNNKDIEIIDLNQVQDYVENTLYDDNYNNYHEFIKIKDSSLIMHKKNGSIYIGDPNTGALDVYFSGSGKYKS